VGEFQLEAGQGETTTTGATKITIRPERVRLGPQSEDGPNRLPGMIERPVYLGNSVQLIVRLANGETVQVLVQNAGEEIPYKQGDPVKVHMPAEALRVLTDTGTAPAEDGELPAVEEHGALGPMSQAR
jgi:ABC-type Fe3+/spermidine/putrescine transport system ATPase subunit